MTEFGDIVQTCITLDDLQNLVETDVWQSVTNGARIIMSRYEELSRLRPIIGNFYGTEEFWSTISDLENQDLENEDLETFGSPTLNITDNHNAQLGEYVQDGAGPSSRPASFYYELELMQRKTSRAFATEYGNYNLHFKNMEDAIDVEGILLEIFEEIVSKVKADGHDDDLLGFYLNHNCLHDPIIIKPLKQQHFTADMVLDYLLAVLQSHSEMNFDDDMIIYFTRVFYNSGAGRRSRYISNTSSYLKKKRSLIEITNKDLLCCARAIIVAKARVDTDPKYMSIRDGRISLQGKMAQKLMEDAGLGNHNAPCGLNEWKRLQAVLGCGVYQLKIYDKDIFNAICFCGPPAAKILHLWLHDNHFDVITSMTAFFEKVYYCEHCDRAYKNRIDHQICMVKCDSCFASKRCIMKQPEQKKCNLCFRLFKNDQCYQNHLTGTGSGKHKKEPICVQLRRCPMCFKQFYTRKGHICGSHWCSVCKIDVFDDHQCYIQPFTPDGFDCEDPLAEQIEIDDGSNIDQSDDDISLDSADTNRETNRSKKSKTKEQKPTTFIFYDMESCQDNTIGQNENGDINKHSPNLIISHKVCDKCSDSDGSAPCEYCKDNRCVFEGFDCIDYFCEWLFSPINKGSIAIAHNSKSYDGQFILDYCHRQGFKPKSIICRGLEIMYMEVGGIKFKDSINFLPMALSALPKAFEVEDECAKGYFPHMFNRRENWSYNGKWPSSEYYQPQYMKVDDRDKFFRWYKEQESKQFNLQYELKKYCENDVLVLKKCCLKFRRLFKEIGGLDPFVESITIASACNKFYRYHHLPINRIAVIPHGGYRKEERQSVIALRWLKWMAHTTGDRIQHKLNGGEFKIGPYKCDGVCGTTVYELYGCAWHGCPVCMTRRQQLTPGGVLTMAEAYQRTLDRKQYIEEQGYQMVEKWECQVHADLKENKEMSAFFKEIKIIEPLDARESFYGGRTNATVLYKKATSGEKIRYIDVLSLYPSICKYGRFPVGHPTVITEEFQKMDADHMPYEGLIKCKILPPTNLLHPLLPYRSNNKLLFPLCSSCADSRNKNEVCQHSDVERALVGAWVSLEIKKALELGYKLLEVYEVWHFEEYEQYDPITNADGGLFTAFINEFLRIKQEADGFPEYANNNEAKQAFINEWKEREGIELRIDKMIKNAGLRAIAKLMLNSFWGKFGQRSKLPKCQYFTNPEEYFRLVFDPAIAVSSIRIINDKLICVTYEQRDEFVDVLGNTNTVIAAYTTAQARLKLYSYIEKLQDRVLYFDTDSIIYIDRPQDIYSPTIGNFLGEMTDELEKEYGPGSFITEFASGGPKHYGFAVFSTRARAVKTMIKVKGFRINSDLSSKINFLQLVENVHAFVLDGVRHEKSLCIQRIERNAERNVITINRKKVYRITYDKRIVLGDFTSIPYGFLK